MDPLSARNIFMAFYILYYTLGIYIVIKDMHRLSFSVQVFILYTKLS